MIPNFFRGLLAEGALSTAFIPVLSEYLADEEKKKEVRKISSAVFTFLLTATIILYAIFLAAGLFVAHTSIFSQRIRDVFVLLRFTFPYLIFVSLAAWCMGILNSYHHFTLPGLSPIVLDFWWVLSLFLLTPVFGTTPEKQIFGLGIGVIIGGISQFVFQLPAVSKYQGLPRLEWDWTHPALKKMFFLFTPMIIGVSVGPINLLTDYSFAHFLQPGMVSALWYATRIYQLPLGIFSVSLATVLLPHFSFQIAKKETGLVRESMENGIMQMFFLLIPSSVWMAVYRNELIMLFFKRGLFDAHSVNITAFALLFFCLGIVFYGAAMVLTRGFYAFNDTRTPVKIGLISIGTNAVLDFVLMRFLNQGGIALSTSVVGLENFLLLAYLFVKKFGIIDMKSITRGFLRISGLNVLWGILLYGIRGTELFTGVFGTVAFGVVAGFLFYVIMAFLLKFPEMEGLIKWKWHRR